MPQMMPINWLIIYILCLTCMFIIIIMINSFILFFKIKNINNKSIYKNWKWMW
nr:TPA_asm: ATP8 [Bombus ussurensis]